MRKDDSTGAPHVGARREPSYEEPIRRWSNVPVTEERACELVELLMKYEDGEVTDALIELICGLTPHPPTDDKYTLDERFLAGSAALMHAFIDTRRARNELGAYVVGLKCARWE